MSFSDDVKRELAHKQVNRPCDAKAELCAAVLSTGGITIAGFTGYQINISTRINSVARYYVSLIKSFFGVEADIMVAKNSAFGGKTSYRVSVSGDDAKELIKTLGLWDEKALFSIARVPDKTITELNCCKIAFLKSCFMCCGYLYNPQKEYRIELALNDLDVANYVKGILTFFEHSAKYACRKSQHVVYLTQSGDVSDFLTRIGAHSAVMETENVMILKEMRNNAARQANCDLHNIDAAVRASEKQVHAITEIDRLMGLDKLPESLRQIAQMRLNNPNISLSDLSDLFDEPISKSGVNQRMRRIMAIYKDLTGEE